MWKLIEPQICSDLAKKKIKGKFLIEYMKNELHSDISCLNTCSLSPFSKSRLDAASKWVIWDTE